MANKILNLVLKPYKKSIFYKNEMISLDDSWYKKLQTLKINATDIWIRLFLLVNEEDRHKLQKVYINRLANDLSSMFTFKNTVHMLSSVFQHYKPLDDNRVQTIILKQIIETEPKDLNDLASNINQLINGQTLTSDYAKKILIGLLQAHINYKSHKTALKTVLKTELLSAIAMGTIENLMNHMNETDNVSTQLLLALLIDPDSLSIHRHLIKYIPTIEIINKDTSLDELVQNLDAIVMSSNVQIKDHLDLIDSFIP